MAKSLTEAAKAVLKNKKQTALTEEATQGVGGAPLAVIAANVPNQGTLKPGSGPEAPQHTLGGPSGVIQAPTSLGDGANAGAIAAAPVKQDSSAPTSNQLPPEQRKAQAQVDDGYPKSINQPTAEILSKDSDDEDIYKGPVISEELQAFIDALVAEGLSEEQIAEAIAENFEIVEEETSTLPENYQVDMSEHVNALLEGEDLSEEFKNKAKTIFEAAVKERVEAELKKFETSYSNALAEEVEKIKTEIGTKTDDYLNYIVENWLTENEVAIETGLRAELTEDFIGGLKNLFQEHYIDIPDDKVNVVEELTQTISNLENRLNEEIETNVTLNKVLSENKKENILTTITEGMTTTQAAKIRTLSEGLDFVDEGVFTAKVQTLKENYFPTVNQKPLETLDPVAPGDEGKTLIAEDLNTPMAKYVKALGRTQKAPSKAA